MSSLVLDLGLPSSNGYVPIRKQAKPLAMAKDRERSCIRLQRMIIGRRGGTLLAFFISAISLLMLVNVASRVYSPSSKPVPDDGPPSDMIFNEQHQNLSSDNMQFSSFSSPPPLEIMDRFQGHKDINVSFSSSPPPLERLERIRRLRIDNHQHSLFPLRSSDHPLPPGHPCQSFTLPPPPADKKRTGP
eukprot:c20290_g2_i1 orf=241-804(+)